MGSVEPELQLHFSEKQVADIVLEYANKNLSVSGYAKFESYSCEIQNFYISADSEAKKLKPPATI